MNFQLKMSKRYSRKIAFPPVSKPWQTVCKITRMNTVVQYSTRDNVTGWPLSLTSPRTKIPSPIKPETRLESLEDITKEPKLLPLPGRPWFGSKEGSSYGDPHEFLARRQGQLGSSPQNTGVSTRSLITPSSSRQAILILDILDHITRPEKIRAKLIQTNTRRLHSSSSTN